MYPWGMPPTFGQPIILNGNNTDELLTQVKSIAKALKKSVKKPPNKKKPAFSPKLSYAGAMSWALALAIPLALLQAKMIEILRITLTTAINGSPH